MVVTEVCLEFIQTIPIMLLINFQMTYDRMGEVCFLFIIIGTVSVPKGLFGWFVQIEKKPLYIRLSEKLFPWDRPIYCLQFMQTVCPYFWENIPSYCCLWVSAHPACRHAVCPAWGIFEKNSLFISGRLIQDSGMSSGVLVGHQIGCLPGNSWLSFINNIIQRQATLVEAFSVTHAYNTYPLVSVVFQLLNV